MPELLDILRTVEDAEIQRLLTCTLSPEELTTVDTYYRAKWTTASREEHKANGGYFAGPGTSYPLKDCSDAHDAWNLAGHADSPDQVRKNVKRWSSEHHCTLPSTAKDGDSDDRAAESDLARATHPFDGSHDHTHSHGDMEHSHDHEHRNDGSHDHKHMDADGDYDGDEERANFPTVATIHADIIRIDKNKREVEGVATSEAVDSFGTVFSYEASKKAFQSWIERTANVREMHDKKAVGKGVGVRFDDRNKKIYVNTYVSRSADGENAWIKLNEGILNGLSVGATKPVWDTIKRGDKTYPYLTSYELTELSLVDNASNPDAQGLMIARADGLTDVVDISEPESVPGSVLSSPLVGSGESEQRAGARVSRESMGALHDARNTSMRSAMGLMKHCGCGQCQNILNALDPDNDGDIDFMGMDDPDNDADSLMANRSQEADMKQIETHIEETLERVFASKLTSFIQRQQSILTRFASIDIPEVPDQNFTPELIRSVVSAEISSLVTPLEERLTKALEGISEASSLSEVRSVLTEVKETVERIAAQPAPGGPILNGGQPIDKRLANQPYQANNQLDPRSFWDEAQRRGLLNTPEAQMQAASAMAIPMQTRR